MSMEYPCIYFGKNGRGRKFSDDTAVSYCVMGPCPEQTLSNADRIRAMDDGSLLDFFVESSGDLGCPPNEMAICDEFDKYVRDACRKCWDNYLTSPVEEDT